VFGPVLTFQTFADEPRPWTLPIPLGMACRDGLHQLDGPRRPARPRHTAGIVWVNTFLVRDLTAPFGGAGISGIGREGGDYALDFYSDFKTLQILDGSVA